MSKTNGINDTTGLPYWKKRRMERPDDVKYIEKGSYLKQTYGITLQEYQQLVVDQGGCCAICENEVDLEPRGRGKSYSGFAVDHCHDTGKVRGLLCYKCNLALGHFKDDLNILKKAIEYLERSYDYETT